MSEAATTTTTAAPTGGAATTTTTPAGETTTTTTTVDPKAETTTLLSDDASTEQTADTTEGSGDEAAPVERVAPEKYEFTFPEGKGIDSEILGKFEGIARELKMPQAEAAKVVEGLAPVIQTRVAQQLADQVKRTSDEWSAAAKSDKEFGGDKLAENLAVAEGALQAFGTPELSALLKESRLGNNPEFIRFCVRAGKALSADKLVTGRTGGGEEKTAAQRLYPSMEK